MFQELSPRIYAYARRQADIATAQEIVSETFLVAWRRLADIPADPLPWLLVVARNTLLDRRRRVRRQDQLADTIARLEHCAGHAAAADHGLIERESLILALAELTDLEREALLMIAWDGLANAQAARVAECSQRAFEVRLSRARARLRRALESSTADGPSSVVINSGARTSNGIDSRNPR